MARMSRPTRPGHRRRGLLADPRRPGASPAARSVGSPGSPGPPSPPGSGRCSTSGLVVEGVDDASARPRSAGARRCGCGSTSDAGVVLAGAIGRSRTQLGVCDLDGDRAGRARTSTRRSGRSPDELMPQVVAGFDRAARRARPTGCTPCARVGLSIPGTVDHDRGREPRLADHDGLGRCRARAVPARADHGRARSTSTTTPT